MKPIDPTDIAGVRERFPAAACIPAQIQESMPPRVSRWQVRDFAEGPSDLGAPLGPAVSTEAGAWAAAREALVAQGQIQTAGT